MPPPKQRARWLLRVQEGSGRIRRRPCSPHLLQAYRRNRFSNLQRRRVHSLCIPQTRRDTRRMADPSLPLGTGPSRARKVDLRALGPRESRHRHPRGHGSVCPAFHHPIPPPGTASRAAPSCRCLILPVPLPLPQRQPSTGRVVERLWGQTWLDAVVTDYDQARDLHCLTYEGETHEWYNVARPSREFRPTNR